jgi:hypothetical protein
VLTCEDIDHFRAREIEVLDAAGKPILSLDAEKRRRDQAAGNVSLEVWACVMNMLFTVPPHTCLDGTFSKPEYVFARDLSKYYSLQPGRYSLMVLRNPTPAAGSRTSTAEASELLHNGEEAVDAGTTRRASRTHYPVSDLWGYRPRVR